MAREKRPAEGFGVAAVEAFACDNAPQGAVEQPPEDDGKGIVEPDDRGGAPPKDIAYFGVVAVGNPARRSRGVAGALPQYFFGHGHPVGFPVQGVEFDVRHAKNGSKAACEGGFAAAGGADNNHALQDGILPCPWLLEEVEKRVHGVVALFRIAI